MHSGNGQDSQEGSAIHGSFDSTESLAVSFDKKTPSVYGWDDYFFFAPYLHKFALDLNVHELSDDDLIAIIHQLPCFEDDKNHPEDHGILRRIRWMLIAKQAREEGDDIFSDDLLIDDLIGGVS